MELTLIVAGLLAAAAGLVVAGSVALRAGAAHRRDLLAAARRAVGRVHARWLPPGCRTLIAQVRPPVGSGWFFGFSAALGLLVTAAGAAVTGALVEDVTDGDGVALVDRPVASFVAAHRSGALTVVMRAASIAGGPVVLAIITAAAGVLLGFLWRRWWPVAVAGVTVAGDGALTAVFKQVLGRSRPPLAHALAAADGYAFPSGHAAVAAAAFGVLAWLCTARLRSWAGRVAIWVVAAVLAALVGISRVYLGVHWTTDVLGGWTVGTCWLAVVITSWAAFIRARRHSTRQRSSRSRPPRRSARQ
jgi:membrane-associated phospholipid phosphatase